MDSRIEMVIPGLKARILDELYALMEKEDEDFKKVMLPKIEELSSQMVYILSAYIEKREVGHLVKSLNASLITWSLVYQIRAKSYIREASMRVIIDLLKITKEVLI